MDGDGEDGVVAELLCIVAESQRFEDSDAVAGSDTGEPDDAEVAGVDLAAGVVDTDLFNGVIGDAEEKDRVVEGGFAGAGGVLSFVGGMIGFEIIDARIAI